MPRLRQTKNKLNSAKGGTTPTFMNAECLSTALFRETRGTSFFRPLSGKNAPFYVDVLDFLEREAFYHPEGMAREEVIAIIVDTLERHPNFTLDDEAGADASPREKSRLLLDHLVKCRWLDEPPRRDWRRTLHLDAHGAALIAALRKIARPDAAVFTDKFGSVCGMLADEAELSERPWQTVESCLSQVREGLNELRGMQKSVQRLTRLQLDEHTLKGNLSVVFDEYSEQISHACYAELVRARLPLRLPEAVRNIEDRLLTDLDAMNAMEEELLRRDVSLEPSDARARIRDSLEELSTMLERVVPLADEIDRGAADFSRRSLARFRYLQDVASERRGEIKTFFERVNSLLADTRLSKADKLLIGLPSPRLPEVLLPAGLDSLHFPPRRHTPAEQNAFEDSLENQDREDGLEMMGRALRASLSVQRANNFVASLEGEQGARISSENLSVHGEEGLTDLISLLLHAESAEACYRILPDRTEHEETRPPVDALDPCRVERFLLLKK